MPLVVGWTWASYSPEPVNILPYMAKRTLADVIKVKNLDGGDYFGSSKWAQYKHMSPKK